MLRIYPLYPGQYIIFIDHIQFCPSAPYQPCNLRHTRKFSLFFFKQMYIEKISYKHLIATFYTVKMVCTENYIHAICIDPGYLCTLCVYDAIFFHLLSIKLFVLKHLTLFLVQIAR